MSQKPKMGNEQREFTPTTEGLDISTMHLNGTTL